MLHEARDQMTAQHTSTAAEQAVVQVGGGESSGLGTGEGGGDWGAGGVTKGYPYETKEEGGMVEAIEDNSCTG